MGTIKMKGIVISENNFGDFDKMLTILTPGEGKISCVAKGARKPKSSLLAGTQLLCFGEFLMYKGSTTYNINSCEIIEVFYNLRTDLDKLNYAMHITKIISDVTTEDENCYKILQLFLNTLYTISESDKDMEFILSVFKLKLLAILGFRPNIAYCVNCKKENEISYFSLRDNGVKCSLCGKNEKSCIHITKSTQMALKYIFMSPLKKLYNFNLKNESLEELKLISKLYFNEKLEKEYTMTKYY